MLLTELYNALNRIENVNVDVTDEGYCITNDILGYSAKVFFDEIDDFKRIQMPTGDLGVQIFYRYEGGLIVTSVDYLFDIQQGPFFTVPNLPSVFSLNLLIDNFISYRSKPLKTENFDTVVMLFYAHKYLIDSAMAKGFDLSSMCNEMQAIRKKIGLADPELVNVLSGTSVMQS
jgi:hypothetical protein